MSGSQPQPDTSDIGMMYRQYLQSKGMPLTAENMSRVVAQSRHEPGMIAGLNVQQDPMAQASTPPNIAGASPRSSGQAPPMPMPTPPMPPLQPNPAQAAPPQAQAQPDAGLPPAIGNSTVNDMLMSLGISGATAATMLKGIMGGGNPPQMSPMPGQAPSPAQISGPQQSLPPPNATGAPQLGGPQPQLPSPDAQAALPPPQQRIPAPAEAPTATSPIGNILMKDMPHQPEDVPMSDPKLSGRPSPIGMSSPEAMQEMTIKPKVRTRAGSGRMRIP